MFVQEGNYRHYHGHGMDTYPIRPIMPCVWASLCAQANNTQINTQATKKPPPKVGESRGKLEKWAVGAKRQKAVSWITWRLILGLLFCAPA